MVPRLRDQGAGGEVYPRLKVRHSVTVFLTMCNLLKPWVGYHAQCVACPVSAFCLSAAPRAVVRCASCGSTLFLLQSGRTLTMDLTCAGALPGINYCPLCVRHLQKRSQE